MNMKKYKKGASIMEAIAVMSIIAAISVGIFFAYEKYSTDSKIESNYDLFTVLKDVSDRTTLNSYDYNNLSLSRFINSDFIADKFKNDNKILNANKENVEVSVKSGDWENSDKDVVVFSADGYNSRQCVRLVSRIGPEYYATKVNGQFVPTEKDSNGRATGSMNMGVLQSRCNRENNTINFWNVKFLDLSRLNGGANPPDDRQANGRNDCSIDPAFCPEPEGIWYSKAYVRGEERFYTGQNPQEAFAKAICYNSGQPTEDLTNLCYRDIRDSDDSNIKTNDRVETLTDSVSRSGEPQYLRKMERNSSAVITGSFQRRNNGDIINENGGFDTDENGNPVNNNEDGNESLPGPNAPYDPTSQDEKASFEYQRIRQMSAIEKRP